MSDSYFDTDLGADTDHALGINETEWGLLPEIPTLDPASGHAAAIGEMIPEVPESVQETHEATPPTDLHFGSSWTAEDPSGVLHTGLSSQSLPSGWEWT